MKFQDYLIPHIPYKPVENPAHLYEIEIRRNIYTDEAYQLYEKYRKIVFNKGEAPERFYKFHCSSPIYDATKEDD